MYNKKASGRETRGEREKRGKFWWLEKYDATVKELVF